MFGSASVYEGGLESEREKLAGGRGSDGGSFGMGARIKLARVLENEAADAMDWSGGTVEARTILEQLFVGAFCICDIVLADYCRRMELI